MDQAEVAFLDDVEQRQARALVLLRDRHDEAQVRVHELTMRFFALTDLPLQPALLGGSQLLRGLEAFGRGSAGLDRLGETDLVVLGEEVVATDVFQIETYEVFVIAVFSAGLHGLGHIVTFGAEGSGLRLG